MFLKPNFLKIKDSLLLLFMQNATYCLFNSANLWAVLVKSMGINSPSFPSLLVHGVTLHSRYASMKGCCSDSGLTHGEPHWCRPGCGKSTQLFFTQALSTPAGPQAMLPGLLAMARLACSMGLLKQRWLSVFGWFYIDLQHPTPNPHNPFFECEDSHGFL